MKKLSEELLQRVATFVSDFVDENGYAPSIRDICDGLSIKSTATAFKYVQKLNEIGVLIKSPQKTRAITMPNTRLKKSDYSSIPLVGKISAGTPITAIENVEDEYNLPAKLFGNDDLFMLTIQGTSMIDAGILDGDKVIIRKMNTCENGEIAACMIDDSATVKRFYKEVDHYRLHPENSTMEDIITKECVILGKVVGLIRNF